MIGRTIRIYLNDGSISGIKHAEIINWTGQAISAPRNEIKELNEWEESKKPGVYFLFGVDEETGEPAAYIGEAENVYDRLINHLANKDFWNEVVFFTSKDNNLTKSHVKYLESRLISEAKKVDRYILQNGTAPQLPTLPRGDKDSMEEFILNLKTLIGVIGHRILENLIVNKYENNEKTDQSEDLNEELYLSIKGINAKAIISNEGIIVLKDSYATLVNQSSLSNGYIKTKQKLFETGILKEEEKYSKFTKDHLFASPSQAAAIIVGSAINGRAVWKNIKGTTLKEIEEKK